MITSTCIAVVLLAFTQHAPPASAPATTQSAASPPLLAGPSAVEPGSGKLTLVQRTFDGKVERVGSQPDAVAIGMLDLSPEQRAKYDEIMAARLSAFDQIIRNNYPLVVEIAALQGESNAALRVNVLMRAAQAIKPYTDRGTFFQEMWPNLTDAQRQTVQGMVEEYREARQASIAADMGANASKRAVASRDRLEAFGEMIRESIERQVGLERETFEQYAKELGLSPEQRFHEEAIFQPLAIKRFQNLEVTKQEQAAAFAEFNKLLTAGQKQKLFGMLVRQYQKPAESATTKSAATQPARKSGASVIAPGPVGYKIDPGPLDVGERLMNFNDVERHRDVPVKMFLPADADEPQPLIVISPGWGGSREGYGYLARHWASHGYACIVLEHDGSDGDFVREAVGATRAGAGLRVAAAMRESVNDESNWINRALDVTFALNELNRRNALSGDELFGRLDLSRVGMSGHSFGAYTTMLIMGAEIDVKGEADRDFRDSRCIAGIAMSSQGDGRIGLDGHSWDHMTAPMLYLTGTKDAEMGSRDVAGRRVAFDRTPADTADTQMLITIMDAEHMAFSDNPRGFGGETFDRNPTHHQWILMATMAFWDAHLNGDVSAQDWLASDALKAISRDQCAVERK